MGRNDALKCFRVLYSRHLTKKRKTYHDGFLKVKADRSIVLYDEKGNQLSSARLRGARQEIEVDSEGIENFDGFLVNCDAACAYEEIPHPSANAWLKTEPPDRNHSSPDRSRSPLKIKSEVMPKVGLKKRVSHRQCANQNKKQCFGDGPPLLRPRTGKASAFLPLFKSVVLDEEVLNLFLNPQAENRPVEENSCTDIETGKNRASVDVVRKPFKPPSVRQKTEEARFDGDALDLRFLLFQRRQCRCILVPDAFKNCEHYTQVWKSAIHEEMQLKLDAFASKLCSVLRALEDERNKDSAPKRIKHEAALTTAVWLRKNGIEYFENCKLSLFKKDKREDDVFFVEIGNLTEETKKSARRHDLWVASPDPRFLFKRSCYGRNTSDRNYGPWIAVFCSAWHGVSKGNKLQLELISKQRPWQGCEHVYLVRGPSIGLEMMTWEAMSCVSSISEPLINALTLKCKTPAAPQTDQRSSSAAEVVDQFGLNEDQAKVIEAVARWLPNAGTEAHLPPDLCTPVCLIHGPYGSGKSCLLVAMIHLLTTPSTENEVLRVLVCAHTNKAVDRIMEGLLEAGFSDLMRIGILDRIALPVLPYSLYYTSESSEGNNTVAELLKRQLENVQSSTEEAILMNELQDVEQGKIHKRREKISTVSVVGVTCSSANNSVLQGQTFDVVIMDEACQVIEPLSILPLIKTEAKFLVAAGDPCQLPPIIAPPTEVSVRGHGLARTLFSRLQSISHSPFLLRTQYRCHPDISKVPNKFFYGGELVDGCSREDRPSLIPDWPALCHVQVSGPAMAQSNSRSLSNKAEATAVVKLVRVLLRHGLAHNQVGVICFYRAQVTLISSLLSERAPLIQVATVDSFQGMEKKVIILSMSVDASSSFASDAQRLNVALTRAKHHLIIVGDDHVLSSLSPCMQALIQESETITI